MDLPILPSITIHKMTEKDIETYGVLSNDLNPIHFDLNAARQAGYPNRLIHGMLTMGISSRLISPWISSGWIIKEYESSFRHPLFIGDSLCLNGKITKSTDSYTWISFNGVNQDLQTVITGKVLLSLSDSYINRQIQN
jgi:3-hydroxybutyryl-CoA dehydratase